MRALAALGVLLALTIGLYWKLTLSNRYTWLENPDNSNLIRPWLDFQAREFQAGRLPLWDPYLVGGQSLVAQLEPAVFNPFNWPLYFWPLDNGHVSIAALNWFWVLIHFVAAAFCYWLCRDLKCGVGASLVGASIYGFLGYVGWAGDTVFSMSCVWVPVAFLFLARVVRGERQIANAGLCGVALGAGFLTGHHNIPVYLAVMTGGVWAWLLARRPRDRRLWAAAFSCLAVWLLVSAVQSLPTIEYGRQALRWVGTPEPLGWKDPVPYSVHAEYSLHARSLSGILVPGRAIHANPFVGIVGVSLALAAVWWRRKESDTRLLALLAAGGLLIALGKDTPLHWLIYKTIPIVEKARYPAMAIAIFHCAVAALAALGLDLPKKTLRRLLVPLAAGGLAGLGLFAWFARTGRISPEHPASVVAAVAIVLAIVMVRPTAVAVLALVLVEAAADPRPIIRERSVPDSSTALIASHADIAEFLKRQPGWFRVEFDDSAVPYNFGDFYGVEQWGGYVPGMPKRIHEILGRPEAPRWYGVQYRVGKAPAKPEQVEVFVGTSGLKVFRDPRIGDPIEAFREQPCAAPDRFRVVNRLPGSAVFEADLGCPALLMFGDAYYRGWRAMVDGKRVPIQEVEGGRRAVRADAGNHRVEFAYQPASVYLGMGLTALGLVLAFTLWRWG
jgi:hypothetical protein